MMNPNLFTALNHFTYDVSTQILASLVSSRFHIEIPPPIARFSSARFPSRPVDSDVRARSILVFGSHKLVILRVRIPAPTRYTHPRRILHPDATRVLSNTTSTPRRPSTVHSSDSTANPVTSPHGVSDRSNSTPAKKPACDPPSPPPPPPPQSSPRARRRASHLPTRTRPHGRRYQRRNDTARRALPTSSPNARAPRIPKRPRPGVVARGTRAYIPS